MLVSFSDFTRERATLCRVLLEARASLESRNQGQEATALHRAAGCGNFACARVLINARADLNARDSRGRAPLDVAWQCSGTAFSFLARGPCNFLVGEACVILFSGEVELKLFLGGGSFEL